MISSVFARGALLSSAAIFVSASAGAQGNPQSPLPPVTVEAPQQKRAAAVRPPQRSAANARGRPAFAIATVAPVAADLARGTGADGPHRAAGAARHSADARAASPRSRRGLPELDRRQYHQGHSRLRARRLRAAEMGRRHAALDPRLRPVAQFPSARRPALHGRHPDQHLGRLWRFPGNRSDRLQICRGLQGRQRAAVRRQFARRRDQFRHADRARSHPERRVGRCRRLRLSPLAGQCRRRQRPVGWFRHRFDPGSGRLPRSQQWHSQRGVSGNVGYQFSPDVETRFYFNANEVRQRIPGCGRPRPPR